MKTETRLQKASRGGRPVLLIVVMTAWIVAILGMLPEPQKASPDTDRTSPASVADSLRLV